MEATNLKHFWTNNRKRIICSIEEVIGNTDFIEGKKVTELESLLCDLTGAKGCVTCASGSDALVLALKALEIGIGQSVLIPSFTFIATGEAVLRVGAIPVFVDIDPETWTIDPVDAVNKLKNAKKRGLLPRAIIPVDIFGCPCDYGRLNEIAEVNNLSIIADSAQSLGAMRHGKNVGTLCDVTCTSFFPTKPLGCYGDGGAVFSDDEKILSEIRSLKHHGKTKEGTYGKEGLNSRLDTIQAAILKAKLESFVVEMACRASIADIYQNNLTPLVSWQKPGQHNRSAWPLFGIRCKEREKVLLKLKAAGIPARVYYRRGLDHEPMFSEFIPTDLKLPETESLCNEILCIPIHNGLSGGDIKFLIETVNSITKE